MAPKTKHTPPWMKQEQMEQEKPTAKKPAKKKAPATSATKKKAC